MSGSSESQAFQAYLRVQALLNGEMNNESSFSAQTHSNEIQSDVGNNTEESDVSGGILALRDPAEMFKLNVNEETFENKLHPDEDIFHEILQSTLQQNIDGVTGQLASDHLVQAEIAGHYASATQKRYTELGQQTRRQMANQSVDSHRSGWKSSVLQRELQEVKAERDLWSLLEILTMSNLLEDINEEVAESELNQALQALPVVASVPDFVNAAYSSDSRIKKGAVLKEWIEKAALDKVVDSPATRTIPGSDTLSRIFKERQTSSSGGHKHLVQSMHPDAQLAADGAVMALDGVDRLDQELLMKTVWQLIRSGQILKAQQTAAEHRIYWLAASLQGVASHFHKPIEVQDEHSQENITVGVARIGNLKQPVWARTCWKHASRLAGNAENWNSQVTHAKGRANVAYDTAMYSSSRGGVKPKDDSLAGVLEMSIYAALSNNTKVLAESPLLSSWHDKVWVYLKAAHERDLSKVIHRYRCIKFAHSHLYPGCDMAVIAAERELLDWSKAELGHVSTGSCVEIFNKVAPPESLTAESLILKLQAAVMEGKSGIGHYIENTIVPVLLRRRENNVAGLPLLLRVFCHFLIWLKTSPAEGRLGSMSDLVSDEMLHLAVESYVEHLTERKQRRLVAAYSVFLNKTKRIAKYAELLRSVQASASQSALLPQQLHEASGQNVEAAEVLQLATIFFPLDVMDITRAVVETAHVVPAVDSGVSNPSRSVRFIENAETPLSPAPTSSGTVLSTPISNRNRNEATPASGALMRHSGLRNRQATPRHVRASGAWQDDEDDETFLVSSTAAKSVYLPPTAAPKTAVSLSASDSLDLQRMESLRWLFFDSSHRVEAVKQTNRLILDFLAESGGAKLHQVRTLLTSYLPFDSVTLGYSLLQQRGAHLADVLNDVSRNQFGREAQDAADVSELQVALELDESAWEASVGKLELWKSLVGAVEDVDAFQNMLADYSAAASRMVGSTEVLRSSLGKFNSKIERAATTAVEAILRTVQCSPYSTDYTNPSRGYNETWTNADSATFSAIIHLVGQVKTSIRHYLDAHSERPETEECLVAQNNLRVELGTVLAVAGAVFSTDSAYFADMNQLLSGLAVVVEQCPATDSDLLLSVSTALGQIKLGLVDYEESRAVRSQVLNRLLTSYLQVCTETGVAMESLEQPENATHWYSRAVQLSSLVASDEAPLMLHSLLSKEDLEAIVLSINRAAMNLLRLDPGFEAL